MTTQDISTAAVHIVGQYNDAAKTLVGAYRTGMHRLLASNGTRYAGFLAKRLDIDTSRVVNLMDRVASTATGGIESVAKLAERVESPLGSSVLNKISDIQMPVAKISVKIADKVAAGARKIETRVAGAQQDEEAIDGESAEVEVQAKPARRRTARKAA
jgi:hypothetical protein